MIQSITFLINPTSLDWEVLKDHVLSQYAEVLNGIGEFPGHYTIHTNPEVVPVVHPPRRLPISLQDTVKAELEEMVKNNIITPVTKPTQWVSKYGCGTEKE